MLLVKAAAQFDEEKSFILGIELPHICMYLGKNIMYISMRRVRILPPKIIVCLKLVLINMI